MSISSQRNSGGYSSVNMRISLDVSSLGVLTGFRHSLF